MNSILVVSEVFALIQREATGKAVSLARCKMWQKKIIFSEEEYAEDPAVQPNAGDSIKNLTQITRTLEQGSQDSCSRSHDTEHA